MRYVLLIFLLYGNDQIFAQLNNKYTFHHLDQTDGILHSEVKGISQDAKGFIWILTLNGLQRFDGSRFINFQDIVSPATGSLSSSDLFVDTLEHKILVLKADHIIELDPGTSKIKSLTIDDMIRGDTTNPPVMLRSESGEAWSIGSKVVLQVDPVTNKTLGAFFKLSPNSIHRSDFIIRDTVEGVYWMNNFVGFQIGNLKTNMVQALSDRILTHPLLIQLKARLKGNYKFRFIAKDSYHNLWISTWGDLFFRYNLDNKVLYTYSLKEINGKQNIHEQNNLTLLVNRMFEDRQRQFWIPTEYAGLLHYQRESDSFESITSDEKISNGLRYNYAIYTMFQDREDNLWLGTDRGISLFNPYHNYFQSIHHIDGSEESMPRLDITDVIETPTGEIWIGTWGGGISVYDQQLNFLRQIHFSGLPDNSLIWSLMQNDGGLIWIGCQAGVLHLYNPVNNSYVTFTPPELQHSTVRSMAKDKDGNILFGLHNGRVTVWKKKENKFYEHNKEAEKIEVPLSPVSHIFVDHNNRAWVSTDTGLYEFDIQQRIYTHLYQPVKLDRGLGYTIQGVEALNDSTLIVGTIYKGMFAFNTLTHTFSRLFNDETLNNSSIVALKKDEDGNIWFTTNYSIYKMSATDADPVQFKMDNSTLHTSFARNGFYALRDGRWVTSTLVEVICFDPRKMENLYSGNIKTEICGLNVFDRHLNIDSFLTIHQPVQLPYNQNFISIQFAALEFSNVREINYEYRLLGVDKNWIPSANRQFADYTDLSPGDYTFEVRTANGAYPGETTFFSIGITPPWWGRTWFRLLVILAIIAIIYYSIRRRIHSIRQEAELKHRITETETMALRSQMNPHFIFNCINGIDAMIQSNDKYQATVYLNKFAKLIRNVLDSSAQNKVPLYKDIETLKLYVDLELFRYQGKFKSCIYADEELLQHDYRVPPLIIQPYVENAIHHGLRQRLDENGKLSVRITKTNDQILYVIEDNGIGRRQSDLDKKEKGYGMQMSRDRIRLFNDEEVASVKVTDLMEAEVATGTRVEVRLKLK